MVQARPQMTREEELRQEQIDNAQRQADALEDIAESLGRIARLLEQDHGILRSVRRRRR